MTGILKKSLIYSMSFWFIILINGCHDENETIIPGPGMLKVIDIASSLPIEGASVYYTYCTSSCGEFCGCSGFSGQLIGKTNSEGIINKPREEVKNLPLFGYQIFHPDYLAYNYIYPWEGDDNCWNTYFSGNPDSKSGATEIFGLYRAAKIKYIIHGSDKFESEFRAYYQIQATSQVDNNCSRSAMDWNMKSSNFPVNRDTSFFSSAAADRSLHVTLRYFISYSEIYKSFTFFVQSGQETIIEIPSLE